MNSHQVRPSAGTVVVVGGGVSGLRAAEQLRARGFVGAIHVIGEEPERAYSRPPLSKAFLTDTEVEPSLEIRPSARATGLEVHTGTRALAADVDAGSVVLSNGGRLRFDGLIIASGMRPRRISGIGDPGLRHPLRTIADARTVRSQLRPGRHVVVLGAGILGCEVASAAVDQGCRVTVVGPEDVPLQSSLGVSVGNAVQRIHEAKGVQWLLRTTVEQVARADRGLAVVTPTETLLCDVVVEAVGCLPDTGWLRADQLDLANGVRADADLRALGPTGPLPHVVVAGDVARFPFRGVVRRFEHWDMAVHTGRWAGANLAAHLCGTDLVPPPTVVPTFWTDQAGIRVTAFGTTGAGTEERLLTQAPSDTLAVGFHADDRLVGAAVVGPPAVARRIGELVSPGE